MITLKNILYEIRRLIPQMNIVEKPKEEMMEGNIYPLPIKIKLVVGN